MPSSDELIYLGIDPGLGTTGYGVLRFEGKHPVLLDAGVIRSVAGDPLPERLEELYGGALEIMEKYRPQTMGIEKLYAHYKHPRTAILMGHARGVIFQKAAESGAEVRSFAATRIKKSLTGNGHASKSQMQRAIQTVLALPEVPEPADVADAIAIALCCASENTKP